MTHGVVYKRIVVDFSAAWDLLISHLFVGYVPLYYASTIFRCHRLLIFLWTPGSQGQTLMSNRLKIETRRSKGRVFTSLSVLSGLCSPAFHRVAIFRLSGDLEDSAICSLLHGVTHHEQRLHI